MTLPADFLALRRQALIIAAAREFRGSQEPIPELPGINRPTPDSRKERLAEMEERRRKAHMHRLSASTGAPNSKTPRERLHTMASKCRSLIHGMLIAITREDFMRLRQQFHSTRGETRRFCNAWGLPMPEIAPAPRNPWGDRRFKGVR